MTPKQEDELERLSRFYNRKTTEQVARLAKICSSLPTRLQGLSYAEFLRIKSVFEELERSIHARDTVGCHSDTGRELSQHIAHPEKFPHPTEASEEETDPVIEERLFQATLWPEDAVS